MYLTAAFGYRAAIMLDQFSILVAIGFSGAALALTFFMMWVIKTADYHLLNWSIGLGLIVAGVVFFGGLVENYHESLLLAGFVFLIAGFGLLHTGSAAFCTDKPGYWLSLAIVIVGVLATSAAVARGYSGLSAIVGNAVIAILLTLSAIQYWTARRESPVLMAVTAALYFVAAASFLACSYALASEGQFVLTARPSNWAEDLNSIVIIIGLTGIGSLSLTLNQARVANRHRHEAMTDALTGLMNRRAFMQNPMDRVPPGTALIVMDLDHFKAINDRFGHDSGDRVLKAFAGLILESIDTNDLAARIGGEEFCILLPNASRSASAITAEMIRSKLEKTHIAAGSASIQTTVSGGIAYSRGGEAIQSLLKRADEALYEAKAEGRNRIKIAHLSLVA
jgi:diguanylate cyclase (GGDEF)-like protein